jgi:hypothetical protein
MAALVSSHFAYMTQPRRAIVWRNCRLTTGAINAVRIAASSTGFVTSVTTGIVQTGVMGSFSPAGLRSGCRGASVGPRRKQGFESPRERQQFQWFMPL